MAGLSACDSANKPTGPSTDDEFELFDIEFRASPAIPGYPGDGDITVTRESAGGGGGDNVLFDLIDDTAYTRTGEPAATMAGTTLAAPSGESSCTIQQQGAFTQLLDDGGTVLYSSIGRWVFDGAPNLAGLTPYQQYLTLVGALHVSFDNEDIVEGFPASGNVLAAANQELNYAVSTRKLFVTAMVDGVCGGEILEDAGL